jgi:predicted methyltransferase
LRDYLLFTYEDLIYLYKSYKKISFINANFGEDKIPISYKGDFIIFEDNLTIDIKKLKDLLKHKTETVFLLDKNGIGKVCFYCQNKVYNLIKPKDKPCTLQINGINMHRVEDTSPVVDAQMKVEELGVFPQAKLLNIGTGLGYTCISACKKWACVTTIEKDENVLNIARINPYSAEFFKYQKEGRIKSILADATVYLKSLPAESFDLILHDPPRLPLAGELYANSFYQVLFTLLKPNGKLYHYVGNPGKKYRNINLMNKIAKRLSQIGFKILKVNTPTFGIIAKKQVFFS